MLNGSAARFEKVEKVEKVKKGRLLLITMSITIIITIINDVLIIRW